MRPGQSCQHCTRLPLTRAPMKRYQHNNMESLERQLAGIDENKENSSLPMEYSACLVTSANRPKSLTCQEI